nr:ribonuclease H-like domain-containing protein [Tanacetum cinerariifolium]
MGTVEDKILVPKPPKNCARCTRCGYLVDGPHCQGCALLRQKLEENLVTYSPDFQNTSEPSNASTNVVNTPREPYVVKQDNGSFVDEIIFDLNRAPDLPNQFHCFHCKDVLRAGETCKRCTCKSCGKDAHTGYNCPSKVLVISIPEPCNNLTINELPQALPIVHPTFHSEAESPFTLDSTPTYVDESPNKREEKWIEEEQVAKAQKWKLPVCYDDDDNEEGYNSLNDNIISELPPYSAVTPTEPIDSLIMEDEHLDTIPATESDEYIKSCIENLIPNLSESEGESECDVPAGFTTFSNVLFNADYDSDSSDDQSFSDEDVPEKIYSNHLFDEEIIPTEIDQHSFNVEYVVPTGRVIVPTCRVIVATGRYVVPTGRVIVPTGRDNWNAIKARFGGNAKSKKMRKSLLNQEFSEFIIGEAKGLHKGSQDAGDAGEFALIGVTSE